MKILLIEDDEFQRLLLRQIITKKTDCAVLEAKNGIEGLRMVEIHSPNLIVLDLMMPVMNGMGMLEQLRHDERHRSIPVVIITSVGDKETIQKAASKGVSGYILKPCSPEQMFSAIAKFLIPSHAEPA